MLNLTPPSIDFIFFFDFNDILGGRVANESEGRVG